MGAKVHDNAVVACPLCQERKPKRACPAVGQQICTVCCGSKRLVQIDCPADCVYLASAREHPAAADVRRHRRDAGRMIEAMRDLSERQSDLFLLVCSFLVGYKSPELHPLVDQDVADAAAALAATLETSARGVIYEHRAASLPAQRLASALKPVIDQAGGPGGTAFERDAAVVLRRLEASVHAMRADEPSRARPFLDLLARTTTASAAEATPAAAEGPRLILP